MENIIANVPLLSEIKTKNGKTSFDLTEKSSVDGIVEVIREERKEYLEECEKAQSSGNEQQEELKVQESESNKDENIDDVNTDEQEVGCLNEIDVKPNLCISEQS